MPRNQTPTAEPVTSALQRMGLIPGLFGMNVGGVPFAQSAHGFWIVLLLVITLVAVGAALTRT
jgi:zinc transporter